MVCAVAVAVNLNQTSFSDEAVEASQLALASPLVVAFNRVPDVAVQEVLGVSVMADEQLSLPGAAGGVELFRRL